MMRPYGWLSAAWMLVTACGSDETPPTPPPAKAEPSEAKPQPSHGGEQAESIDASQYWLLRAMGMVRAERETDNGQVVTVEDRTGEQRTVLVSRDALHDAAAREAAYLRAVHVLGRELGSTEERRRRRAEERIEALTKTTRKGSMGAASPWLAWYREFGDFLRFNPDLERVEVDPTLAETKRAASIQGLGLRVVGDSDRFKRGEPIKITVLLSRDAGAEPQWVNRRLRLPDELTVELHLEEDNSTTIVSLLQPEPAGPATRDDFVVLTANDPARTTIELTKLVEGELAPGTYAVSATYRNEQSGEDLGLEPGAAATVWASEVSSARHRFRIVPW